MPTKTPLMFAGINPQVFSKIKSIFEDMGFSPMQTGGSSLAPEDMEIELEPGCAVSTIWATGDLDISAIGTLTYRDEDKLLAFGHSMFDQGKVEVPLAGGYIHAVIPSLFHSYKMGASTKIVGMVSQDRGVGILGELGKTAKMIPMDVSLTSSKTGRTQKYHYELMNSQSLIGLLSLVCALQSLSAYETLDGQYSLDVDIIIKIKGYPDVNISDFITEKKGVALNLAFNLGNIIFQLTNSPFEDIQLENIDVKVDYISNELNIAKIKGIRLNKTSFRPGETLVANLIIDPYNKDEYLQRYTFKIPEDYPDGELILAATDVEWSMQIDREISPFKIPQNVNQLIESINKTGNARDIKIQLIRLGMGTTVEGIDLPGLPPSILSVMVNPNEVGTTSINIAVVLHEEKIKTNYKIEGFSVVGFKVDRKSK